MSKMDRTRRFAQRFLYILGSSIAITILVIAILMLFQIRVNLGWIKGDLEQMASTQLQRQVTIDGQIKLVPSLWPAVEITDIKIANPRGWEQSDFARIGFARVKIGLLPLVLKRLDIHDIELKDSSVFLLKTAEGLHNWTLGQDNGSKDSSPGTDKNQTQPSFKPGAINNLLIEDVSISYKDTGSDKNYDIEISSLKGNLPSNQDSGLSGEVFVNNQPIQIVFNGGGLKTLLDSDEPWPLNLYTTIFSNTFVEARGSITDPMGGGDIDLSFALEAEESQTSVWSMTPFDISPPEYRIEGKFESDHEGYKLNEITGNLGATWFNGNMALDFGADLPRVSGRLELSNLDLQSMSALWPSGGSRDKSTLEMLKSDREIATLDLLRRAEVNLELLVDQLANSPLDMSQGSIKVMLSDGVLDIPFAMVDVDSGLEGHINLNMAQDIPKIKLDLKSQKQNLDSILRLLGVNDLRGGYDSLSLGIASHGDSPLSIVTNMDLEMRMSGGNFEWVMGKNRDLVGIKIADGVMQRPQGKGLRVSLKGEWLDRPTDVELGICDPMALFQQELCSYDIRASQKGADLQVRGSYDGSAKRDNMRLGIRFRGERVGDLWPFFEINSQAEGHYGLGGNIVFDNDNISVDSLDGKLGATMVKGGFNVKNLRGARRLYTDLAFDMLDINDLDKIFSGEDRGKREKEQNSIGEGKFSFVKKLGIKDGDLNLKAKRLRYEDMEIEDIELGGKLLNGLVINSPVMGKMGDSIVKGTYSLDITDYFLKISADVSADDIEIGGLLGDLGLAEGIYATASEVQFRPKFELGANNKWIDNVVLDITAVDGIWSIRDRWNQEKVKYMISQVKAKWILDESIDVITKGSIKNTPLNIRGVANELLDEESGVEMLGMTIDAESTGTKLSMSGEVVLPLRLNALNMKMSMSGDDLQSLNKLVGIELPHFGPYSVEGNYQSNDTGYFLRDLVLHVGESDLKGSASILMDREPTYLDVELSADSVQIRDILWREGEGWAQINDSEQESQSSDSKLRTLKKLDELLNYNTMSSLDARVDLDIDRLRVGQEEIGRAEMGLTLEQGHLNVEPFNITWPGGAVNVDVELVSGESEMELKALVDIEQFQYGLLWQMFDPQSEVGGEMDLELSIQSSGKNITNVMSNADGKIDVKMLPASAGARIFDIWALGLVNRLIPNFGERTESKVNCIIGELRLNDGVLKPDRLYIDTTNVRVRVKGNVDFGNNEIDLLFNPRAKRPQLVNFGAPIRVSGTITDHRVGVDTSQFVWFFVRMAYFVYDYAVQIIRNKIIPADGNDLCLVDGLE